jgi:hypothetical protein
MLAVMIEPVRLPRPLGHGGLHALHVSLNSPVVAQGVLPRGPASAAVALDPDGAQVCLRSVRAGRTTFFASSAELAATPRLALDAALSFAEGLGFLFDDDEVALRGADAAAALWTELCGDAAQSAPDPAHTLSKFRLLARDARLAAPAAG